MSKKNKIVALEKLGSIAAKLRTKGKTIALCHGTFDLLHIGHIKHIQLAKAKSDYLFVTITADQHVNKGPDRPVFGESHRSEQLAALSDVSYVAINDHATSENVIDIVKPHFYIKGSDYKDNEGDLTGNIFKEVDAVERHGGEIIYTEDITYSSSKLLNEHFDVFPAETKEFLTNFKKLYSSEKAIEATQGISGMNTLVLGDAIVDEYHYTQPLGQTGKFNILSVKYENKEQFAGGAIAVANHVSDFLAEVTLLTGLGSFSSHEEFIRSKIKKNVFPEFYYFENAPTLTKRRYVDSENSKLFEVYYYNDTPVDDLLDKEVCKWLKANVAKYDVVIIPDFGNGFITEEMIEICSSEAKFLAVNTQLNSGNRGYHAITRYPRADFISLNEAELRMATHDRQGGLRDIAYKVGELLDASYIAVTRGRKGIELLDLKHDCYIEVPALSTAVVDRVGAGDAFLALSAALLGGSLDPRVAAFMGAAAAALDVQIVCNRDSVNSSALFKYVTTLLK